MRVGDIEFACRQGAHANHQAALVFSGIIVAPRWAVASCLRHRPDVFVTTIWCNAGQVAVSQLKSIEFRVLRLLTKEPLSDFQTDHIGLPKVDHQRHICAKSQSLPTPFFQ
jgi:hypothetical protein